jgi:hypothetical protein
MGALAAVGFQDEMQGRVFFLLLFLCDKEKVSSATKRQRKTPQKAPGSPHKTKITISAF